MEHYIPEYEIPVLERAARDGDLDAAERLERFYDSEIASMSARRDSLRVQLAAAAHAAFDRHDEQHF